MCFSSRLEWSSTSLPSSASFSIMVPKTFTMTKNRSARIQQYFRPSSCTRILWTINVATCIVEYIHKLEWIFKSMPTFQTLFYLKTWVWIAIIMLPPNFSMENSMKFADFFFLPFSYFFVLITYLLKYLLLKVSCVVTKINYKITTS